ncbi:MAG: hypothetical protein AAF799_29505 [Myxococcota bacterium]
MLAAAACGTEPAPDAAGSDGVGTNLDTANASTGSTANTTGSADGTTSSAGGTTSSASSTGDEGSTDPDSGTTEDDSGILFDLGNGPDVGNMSEPVEWMLNSEGGTLYRVSRVDASTVELCELINPETGSPFEFSSMTFTRDDRLIGANNGSDGLWEIELPSCVATRVATYPGNVSGVNGISPDEDYGLYAVDSTTDRLYRVDVDTGVFTEMGPAGFNIGNGGATWVEADQMLMAVEAGTNSMYEVNTTTGTYSLVTALSETLGLVGFEHHPDNGALYICTNNNQSTVRGLYEVTMDGTMTFIGDLGYTCNDLAAPWAEPELPPVG